MSGDGRWCLPRLTQTENSLLSPSNLGGRGKGTWLDSIAWHFLEILFFHIWFVSLQNKKAKKKRKKKKKKKKGKGKKGHYSHISRLCRLWRHLYHSPGTFVHLAHWCLSHCVFFHAICRIRREMEEGMECLGIGKQHIKGALTKERWLLNNNCGCKIGTSFIAIYSKKRWFSTVGVSRVKVLS